MERKGRSFAADPVFQPVDQTLQPKKMVAVIVGDEHPVDGEDFMTSQAIVELPLLGDVHDRAGVRGSDKGAIGVADLQEYDAARHLSSSFGSRISSSEVM